MATLEVPANRFPTAADDRGVRNRARGGGRARWHKKIGLTRRGLNLVNPKIQDSHSSHYSFQVGKRQDGSCVGKYRTKVPSPTQTCQRPTNRGIQFRLRKCPRSPRWVPFAGPPLGIPIACSSETSWPLLNLRPLRGLGPAGKNVFPFVCALGHELTVYCLVRIVG